MADMKLSELAVVPGNLPLTGDFVYVIRGNGASPEIFTGYKSDISTFLGGANSTDYEESVLVATDNSDGNITLSGLYTLQGVALAAGDRVLPTAQTLGQNNRVWVVAAGAWTIAEGWDTTDTITAGKIVPIEAGDNAGKKFQLLTIGTIVPGTTSLSWDTDTPVAISNFLGVNRNGAAETLAVSWAKTWNFMIRSGVQTATIPTNATAPIVVGSEIIIQHDGTGVKTVACVSGAVTLNGVAGASITLATRGDAYLLKKKGTNAWTATPMVTGLKADVSSNLTKGFTSTGYAAGTKSSGTFTPDPVNGNIQIATNGGAHALAPPSVSSPADSLTMVIKYTNNASAGAITTAGFTKVTGDAFTTTNGHIFFCYISVIGGTSHLNVVAMQ